MAPKGNKNTMGKSPDGRVSPKKEKNSRYKKGSKNSSPMA